jgi:hypothetical protein
MPSIGMLILASAYGLSAAITLSDASAASMLPTPPVSIYPDITSGTSYISPTAYEMSGGATYVLGSDPKLFMVAGIRTIAPVLYGLLAAIMLRVRITIATTPGMAVAA